MASEVVEHDLPIAIVGGGNSDGKGKEMGITENSSNEEQVRKKHDEGGNAEQIQNYVIANTENELNVINSDFTVEAMDAQDDKAPKTLDKSELYEKMLEAIDDPPDSFFDGLLEDDFLDSLAVVDAWNPDADDSCGSDTGERKENDAGREEGSRNRESPSESDRKDREESISKTSVGKSRREYSDSRRSRDHSSRSDSRRHTRTSVEMKQDSRERSVGRTGHRREKVGIDKYLQEIPRRHQHVRDRSRERYSVRRERVSRDSDEKSTHRRVKGSTDSTERSRHRSDRKSRESSTEKNISSSSRENKDLSVEISVRKDDRGRAHRYSYQYRVSNRERTSDRSEKERKSDLQGVFVDGKDGVLQNPRDINRREDSTYESLRKKGCDINVVNKEIQTGSVCKEHNMGKEMPHVASGVTEQETGDQKHMVTKPNNPALNNTKLDTCIKELDDLVPPGTESDFILATKDEADEFKTENDTSVKVEPKFGIVNDRDLSPGGQKSSRYPMIKTESSKKEIHVKSEKNAEYKLLENVKSEKDPSCATSEQLHKEADRVNSSHERKRRRSRSRSRSSRSERRKSSAPVSKRKHYLDEERKRKSPNSSPEGRKRKSKSLDREFGAARIKTELDETVRKRRLHGSGRGENRSRSQSREKWQYHSDSQRLKGRKDDQNVTRQSRSGSRDKKHELSVGRERIGRSRSRDRQYRRTQNDARRSRSGSRGKRESVRRSRDPDSQYRKASSAERWQADIDAQKLKRKNDVRNESRRLVRSVSKDKDCGSSLPVRILRSRSRDRAYRSTSSKYRDRQGRLRRSVSWEVEKKRPSLKSRRSPSWDKNKRRTSGLSPVSQGPMSLSPSISFELSSSSPEREWRRHRSRSRSRKRRSREYRRSYRGSSFSPVSSRSVLSRSGSFVSLTSLSDESYYRRQPRRKRSPFWKEIERKFAKDLHNIVNNQSAVYPLPSAAGPVHHEGCNPSSYPASDTFPPAAVPYPPDHTGYSHCYPSQTGFSAGVIQPSLPPPENPIPSSFVSAPPVHLPVPPVMPPTPVPLPVPPPVYNVPPPAFPSQFTEQVAPLSVSMEFPSLENVFSQPLYNTEKSEDPPQVPPPPKISQSSDVKKMSLSSLLEASAKVGGSAKKKQMSVDPVLVVHCEEAIRRLEANDGVILVCPGHLVLRESPKPSSSAAAVTQVLLEANMFQSPILRKPDLQLSFTSPPVCDEVSESSCEFLKRDTKSLQGQSNSESLDSCAVTSPHAPDSAENFKVYVDSTTMTDICGDFITTLTKSSNKSQTCSGCLKNSNRIMVWNYTQTPPISVESVGVQAQMVNVGALSRLGTRRRANRARRTLKEGGSANSDTNREKVNKHSSASHSNASKSASSGCTTGLKEDMKVATTGSRQRSPRRSHLSTSTNKEGGRRDKDILYGTSSYETYGRSSLSASSGGRNHRDDALSSPVSQSTEPPKGILKTRTNTEMQPPPPSPHIPCQESSLKGCDLPRYSVTSPLQTSRSFGSPGTLREMGTSPGSYSIRRGSSLFGEMDSSSRVQPSVTNTGPTMPGGTSSGWPMFDNPDIRVTLTRNQDFYNTHHDRFSPSLHRSGSPGVGLRMQAFQQQSSAAFHHPDDPSMMPYDPDIRY